MKKLALLSLSVMALTGCLGTKYLSPNISEQGTVNPENIVFPKPKDAWVKGGTYPALENLSVIHAGISKDELYRLIGHPHFKEAHNAREWDYVMNFHHNNQTITCQYKIIFDKKYQAQQFYWLPAECEDYASLEAVQPQPVVIQQPIPVVMPMQPIMVEAPPLQQMIQPQQPESIPEMTSTPIVNETVNLSADTLFYFDRYTAQDMLPHGKNQLDMLANKLAQYSQQGNVQVMITGHTDRLGDDNYNMNLSLLRAQTVRNYLAERGVDAGAMWATGAGESQPIKQCADNANRQITIDCLQPNRRVEVNVAVYPN